MVVLAEPEALLGEAAPSPAGPAPADGPRPDAPCRGRSRCRARCRRCASTCARSSSSSAPAARSARCSGCAGSIDGTAVVTSHPDHVRSLFTAKPELAPSLTGRVAAAPDRRAELGAHRARPAPHAPAQAAAAALPRRGDRALHASSSATSPSARSTAGRVGRPFALAPRMQAITLDVIMAGIFGIEGRPGAGHPRARAARPSPPGPPPPRPVAQVAELMNIGRDEPVGMHARRSRCSTARPTP